MLRKNTTNVLVNKFSASKTVLREKSDFQTLIQLRHQSSIITLMGNLISTILFTPPHHVVQFYKCPLLDFEFDMSDQFLLEEDNFVILSTPNAIIITIEESDY